MTKRRQPTVLVGLWLGGACLLAAPMLMAIGDVVPPVGVSTPEPERPASPFGGPPREGWIVLRYSVRADGTTDNVRVVEALPPGLNTDSSVRALRQWRFEPARDGDQQIEWHNNVEVVVFNNDGTPQEATPIFAQAYEQVAESLRGERLRRAKSQNETMQNNSAFRLYELGMAQMQLAALELADEDLHAALAAIRRATEPSVPQLGNEELKTALEYRFAIEVQLGRAVDALETYARRTALEPLPSDHAVTRQAEAIQQALQNEATALVIQARIDAGSPWAHELTRRTFAVSDVDGRIQDIDVECNRSKVTLPFEPEVEITVPEGWGECTLFFNGRRNTTFTLYEFN